MGASSPSPAISRVCAAARAFGDSMAGTLYVVATPLGNLEDLTPRAARVLCEVDLVACEDTRRTGLLLRHVGSRAKLLSTYAHNEARRADQLLERLESGDDIALVSDAGTPCISDPGERVVSACQEAGHRVVPIPGPSAPITLLSAAGLPTSTFHFVGFAPRAAGAQTAFLTKYLSLDGTVVLYESARRVVALLERVIEVAGANRMTCVGRELTKLHEEIVRGPVAQVHAELAARDQLKGEVTVAIEGVVPVPDAADVDPAVARLITALREEGLTPRSMRDIVASTFELHRKEAYARVLAVMGSEQHEE